MKTIVNYNALLKAESVVTNISSGNSLTSFTSSLGTLAEDMATYTKEHDCFSGDIDAIMELQNDVLNRDIEVANLLVAIQLVIKTFQEAEGNITSKLSQDLKNILLNCFSASSGLVPFQYHEIEAFNKENNADFRIQGYTIANGYYLITAYDHDKKYNSRVYIYDKTGKNIGYIELDDELDKSSHVGGITYDEKHNILMITGQGGIVNSYNFTTITKALKRATEFYGEPQKLSKGADLSIIEKGSVNISEHIEGRTSAATTYYSSSDNALYVADCAGTGTLVKYAISYSSDGKIAYDSGKVVSKDFASCCQGVATYESPDGKNYIYASQSYGASHSSVLKKYEITKTGTKEVGATIIDTPGLEGIQIDSAGNVSGVFENFKKVDNPNETLNINVNTQDFSKTLNELDPDLEKFYQTTGSNNKRKLNSGR